MFYKELYELRRHKVRQKPNAHERRYYGEKYKAPKLETYNRKALNTKRAVFYNDQKWTRGYEEKIRSG